MYNPSIHLFLSLLLFISTPTQSKHTSPRELQRQRNELYGNLSQADKQTILLMHNQGSKLSEIVDTLSTGKSESELLQIIKHLEQEHNASTSDVNEGRVIRKPPQVASKHGLQRKTKPKKDSKSTILEKQDARKNATKERDSKKDKLDPMNKGEMILKSKVDLKTKEKAVESAEEMEIPRYGRKKN
ncbi:hypothetical protein ScalyP_jg4185 [Parmales sp. scaly parma]|nr:hypothetical protein ScalyP_jg4185 [Parmales sp. scaly parma]|tara:strand:- start:423 stop:980 length:558 start_codon:yes stop_codon:yes gene_type:complete